MYRDNLTSLAYWRSGHQPQRFYTAFCLLVSSVQDWALGFKEARSENLNWSATCSYYSLVHAGRLLTFLALGEFPTSHSELRKLLSGYNGARVRTSRPPDHYPFDWLQGFTRRQVAGTHLQAQPIQIRLAELRQAVLEYLELIHVALASRRLDEFGRVFSAAGPLRSDSNYEALLIAHEYEHVTVSSGFKKLADCMNASAKRQLPFAIEGFRQFLAYDPDLDAERPAYRSFLEAYLDQRLLPSIRRKLAGFPEVEGGLSEIAANLRVPGHIAVDYGRLEQAVSMEIFGAKAALMSQFQHRIDDLCLVVRDTSPNHAMEPTGEPPSIK